MSFEEIEAIVLIYYLSFKYSSQLAHARKSYNIKGAHRPIFFKVNLMVHIYSNYI